MLKPPKSGNTTGVLENEAYLLHNKSCLSLGAFVLIAHGLHAYRSWSSSLSLVGCLLTPRDLHAYRS